MKRFYITTLFLVALFFTQKTSAQISCHASFYLDTTSSTAFNAVLVNNSYFSPALVAPDTSHYVWMWGDGTSSTTKLPTHTYTSAGAKTIVLFVSNTAKTATDSMVRIITIDTNGGFHKTNGSYTFTVVAPAATGIATQNSVGFVSLNSTIISQNIILNFSDANAKTLVNAEVYTYEGKHVMSVNENLTGNTLSLPTSSLKNGMYFMVVSSGTKTSVLKFVKL